MDMKIVHCLRCNRDWCYRGLGRALRCGKCKSPYWDREVLDGKVSVEVDASDVESKDQRVAVQSSGSRDHQQSTVAQVGGDVRPDAKAPSVLSCPVHGAGCGFAKVGGWWCSKDGRLR